MAVCRAVCAPVNWCAKVPARREHDPTPDGAPRKLGWGKSLDPSRSTVAHASVTVLSLESQSRTIEQ